MDLIKNLTLYDLLGYTFPGVILLEVIQFHIDVFGKISVDGILAGILGFVMGIVMAEFMDFIVTAVRGIHRRIRSRNHKLPDAGPLQKCCETIGITREMLTRKLVESGMLPEGMKPSFGEMEKYGKRIYAHIQKDAGGRIHNYASAVLLYKNLVMVSCVMAVLGCYSRRIVEIIVGAVCCLAFFRRYRRFDRKVQEYALSWFLEETQGHGEAAPGQ